jgi:hypothetical protein
VLHCRASGVGKAYKFGALLGEVGSLVEIQLLLEELPVKSETLAICPGLDSDALNRRGRRRNTV